MSDTALDELDELARDTAPPADDAPAGEAAPPLFESPASPAFVRVCDKLTPAGEVCGETISSADFDTDDPESSARAAWARHVRFEHPKSGAPADKPRGRKPRASRARTAREVIDDAPTTPSVPTVAHVGNRAEQYTQGLASLALMAWLTPASPFDDFDLSVVNAGAPNLGAAFSSLADRHKLVGQTLDLVLVGGGGPYAATLFAALAVAAPICEHHGLIPPGAGARFGALIGVVSVPPPDTRPVAASERGGPHTTAPDDVPQRDDAPPAEPVDGGDAIASWLADPPTPSAAFEPATVDEPVTVRGGVVSADALAHA